MEDDPKDPEDTEAAVAQEKPKRFQIRAVGTAIARTLGRLLPRLGLYLFMLVAPLIVTGYPAYMIAARVADYAQAKTLEAEFVGMDIKKVKDVDNKSALFQAKGHIDVLLSFKTKNGEKYVAVLKMPWTSPGLKGRMDEQFRAGDVYTLYLTADGAVYIDEEVAKDNFAWLTALMGLILVAYVLFVLIRKRLSTQQPEMVHRAATALAKSLIAGQLVALLVAAGMLAMIEYQPVFVPDPLYLGIYWGLVVFLTLSLRLLVFQNGHAEKPAEPEPAKAQKP